MALERDRAKVETGLRDGNLTRIGVARPVEIKRQNAEYLSGAAKNRRRAAGGERRAVEIAEVREARVDRKSVVTGKRVSVRVDLGGSRNSTKKQNRTVRK